MIALKLDALKKGFFDAEKVLRAEERAVVRTLSKQGAFIRRKARDLIKKRKDGVYSKPGDPPFGHGTQLLKSMIVFSYEPRARSVIVGPAKTNQVFFRRDGRPVTGTVPRILEQGGQIRILEVFKAGRWQRADLRSKRRLEGLETRLRTVDIKPRPYMSKAFAIETSREKNAALWKDVITTQDAA